VPSRKAPCRIAPSGYVARFMAAPSLRRKRRPRSSSGHRPPRPPSTRRNRRTQTGGTRRWDGVMARSAGRRTRAIMRCGHHACRTLTSFVATTLTDDSRSISLITAKSFRFFIDPGVRPECEQRDTRCQECVVAQVLKDDRVLYAGCQQSVPHVDSLQSRAVHTPASTAALSGASAVFRGSRPASLPTATTRHRGRLSLIATIRQEVLGVSGDPDVGQERPQIHVNQ
jgi:hypothetical protein